MVDRTLEHGIRVLADKVDEDGLDWPQWKRKDIAQKLTEIWAIIETPADRRNLQTRRTRV